MVSKTKTRKPTSFQKAQREAQVNTKGLHRHINKVWNAAVTAPMYCREYQVMEKKEAANGGVELVPKVGKDGKPVMARRSARLIAGHAYNIACAGAVRAAVRELKQDYDTWGMGYPNTTQSPFMLGIPKGTKLMLEQFLSAYVATGVLHATRMMKAPEGTGLDSNGKAWHKRLNKAYIQRAFATINAKINATSGTTSATCVVPLKVKKATDYVPPAQEEPEEEVVDDDGA
tara:strand:- start:13663 stop:14352 length:690 start_codon:yes stop_codon:yes gene_type:complete